jgi:alanine racemase
VDFLRRTWAEIDLDALETNFRAIRSSVGNQTKIMAVVKADAYGHGVEYCAPAFVRAGADMLGVSNIDEAEQLRLLGIRKPILILGFSPPECAASLYKLDITQTVFSAEYAKKLSQSAKHAGVTVAVHIKADTGMARLGFACRDENMVDAAAGDIARATALPGLKAEGLFTHFASADFDGDPDGGFTRKQFELFGSLRCKLAGLGVNFNLCHCCNSAGTLAHPDMRLNMVRPGISLYGLSCGVSAPNLRLTPALTLKTVAVMVKPLEPGASVSYGRTYSAEKPITAATVPVGYADGYSRLLSSRGEAVVNGKRAKIIGRICMDQTLLDVTGIPGVVPGTQVTLIGGGEGGVTADEFAAMTGTVGYETVCLIGKRVPRVFFAGGQQVGVINTILK